MILKPAAAVTTIILLFTSACLGDQVFDLKDEAATFDGNTVAAFANDGGAPIGFVTGTFTSTGGNLNSNVAQFGIDAPGGAEDADAIESGELLEVTFDIDLFVTALDLQDFTGTDEMMLTIGANAPVTLSDSGAFDVFNFNANNFLPTGSKLTFAPSVGDFAISTFSVSAVPEPSAFLFLGLTGLCFWGAKYGKRRWFAS